MWQLYSGEMVVFPAQGEIPLGVGYPRILVEAGPTLWVGLELKSQLGLVAGPYTSVLRLQSHLE